MYDGGLEYVYLTEAQGDVSPKNIDFSYWIRAQTISVY
jgi:hypothetical protein